MRHIIGQYGTSIAPGDIFIGNDPHIAGGTHLPDINLAMPVFTARTSRAANSPKASSPPITADRSSRIAAATAWDLHLMPPP